MVGRYRTRENDGLVTVYFANGLTLSGTTNHPVWLPSEVVWVDLGELEAGDRLLSRYGLVTVAQVTSPPAAPVYNISVQQQHVYEVTEWGIVVHNNKLCIELAELRKKKRDAENRGEELSEEDRNRLNWLEEKEKFGELDGPVGWPFSREFYENLCRKIDSREDLISADTFVNREGIELEAHSNKHSISKEDQLDVLNNWERAWIGTNSNGRPRDIYWKNGKAVITQSGQKHKVITAYEVGDHSRWSDRRRWQAKFV